jgi:hypothetical protein
VDVHTFNKQAKKVYINLVCQKADGNCFLEQERSADGGIHATMDHNNNISVLQNTKKLCRAKGELISGVVLLHDNAHLHTAAST